MLDAAEDQRLCVEKIDIISGSFKTRCLIAGPQDGDVVVLLHDAAFGGAADVSWSAIIPELAKTYRVIAPDLLGFGAADKAVFVDRSPYDFRNDHILSVLEVLGVNKKIHLIGSSFGGSMGLHMLREHADRLASVVSIAGAGGGWRTPFGRTVLGTWDGTKDGLRVITQTLANGSEQFDFEAHLEERFAWASMPGHYRAVVAAGIKLPEALVQTTERDPFPKVPDSDVKVLLIAGVRDELVVPEWPEELMPFLPSKTTVIRLDSKHSPNLEIPHETLNVLNDWLAEF